MRWAKTWSLAMVVFLLMLVTAESSWRRLGYLPALADSPALWRSWYDFIACGDSQAIAIIGSSRIQSGVSAAALRGRLPRHRVAQLGKDGGGSPIGVLRALAYDDRFRGLVVCDALEPFLLRTTWDSQGQLYGQSEVALSARLELAAAAMLDGNLGIRHNRTGCVAVLRQLASNGRPPAAVRVRMTGDRTLVVDFWAVSDLPAYTASRTASYRTQYESAGHPAPHELDDEVREIDEFVRRIQSRGGQVVFLRMPSSGELRSLEDTYHPKATYWDRYAAQSRGVWIHADQLTADVSIRCPDESHLDEASSLLFTDALVDALHKLKVL